MRILWRLILGAGPLALTPLWGYLIAESYLNFGGGDKDLFLLVPWMLWTLAYLIIFVVCWIKRLSIKKTLMISIAGATLALLSIALVLYIGFPGFLGVP